MPARRGRSGAIWAGAALSGLAHAGLVALALVAPPWLRPHRERPVPVVAVALVTPAAFEAALAALRRPAPAPEPPPAPPRSAPSVAARPAVAVPAPEEAPEEAALPSLAPAFDPEAPLGLGVEGPAGDLPAHRPRARQGSPAPVAAVPDADPAEAAAGFEAAVRAAVVERFEAGPRADGGGAVRLALIVNREGRLLAARLVAGSGSAALDRAAAEAARTALLPEMPDAMPNTRVTIEVELSNGPGRGG